MPPTPARDLLLRIICSSDPAELAEHARRPADWEALFQLAQRLRLAPAVYLKLAGADALAHLPPVCQRSLIASYHHNRGRNIAYASLLIRLIEILGREGIEIALLKGIAYVHDCYSDPGERVLGDIDLLVREDKLEASVSVLLDRGFKIKAEWEGRHPGHHHVAPLRDDSGLVIEIHHNLAPEQAPVAVSNLALWQRARPGAEIAGAYRLSPEDALIHASIHLMVSSGIAGQIYQLVDISRLVAKHFPTQESFSPLKARAAEFHCSVPVMRALGLAQRMLGTPVAIDSLPGRKDALLLHLAEATIAGPAGGLSPLRYEIYRDLLDYRKQLLVMPGGHRRAAFTLTRPLTVLHAAIKAGIRSFGLSQRQ